MSSDQKKGENMSKDKSMRIFVGSSKESKELAIEIAQDLGSAGFTAYRWWEQFPAGTITLDRLLEIAEDMDGAVLLFMNDDKLWYRDRQYESARDNVSLEYGIFVSKLGRKQTLIVRGDNVKLPTDLTGITYQTGGDSNSTIKELVVKHFENLSKEIYLPPLDEINLVADPETINEQLYIFKYPSHPHIRDLYLGLEGAKAWLAVVNDPTYSSSRQERKLLQAIKRIVKTVNIRSFVSLGPGNGKTDQEIAMVLRDICPRVQYIPVDISDGLLQIAIKELSKNIPVPLGIMGDFEERMNFINNQLKVYAPTPILYTLLGATIGNFKNEGQFFADIKTRMEPKDRLLIDISIAADNWTLENDRSGNVERISESYKLFFSQGIARRTGNSTEQVYSTIDERLSIQEGESEVEGTKSIVILDKKTNQLVYIIRRYNWDKFPQWCEENGLVVQEKECVMPPDKVIGDAVLLLSKQKVL